MGDNRERFVVKENSVWAVVSGVLGVSCEDYFCEDKIYV
jgi:hypothetical protein